MFRSSTLRAAMALAFCVPAAASAQDAAKLFAKAPEYQAATLSPNGEFVAVTTPFEDRRALSLIKLSGAYDRSVIKFGAKEQPINFHWTNDTRLVVEKAKDYGFLVGNLASTGDVYAADADGTNQKQLFGYVVDAGTVRSQLKDDGGVEFLGTIPGTEGEALYAYTPRPTTASQRTTSVFRVDTHTGSRKQLASFNEEMTFVADRAGTPRIALSRKLDGTQVVRYRRLAADTEWTAMPAAVAGKHIEVWGFDADNDHVFAQVSDKGEPAAIYRLSLSAGTREKLAGHPALEADYVGRGGFNGVPAVVSYTSGRPKIDYIDTKSPWVQLHAGLMKAFPGQLVRFVDTTRDDGKLLFFVYSDRHPGAYYLFDRKTSTPQLLFETSEWIDPAKMSPMMPVEFKNRGGETLYGYFTAPLGSKGPVPLVVMPHGGPFGVEDHWGFDPDVQFLASLGYGVLQVNYRGSGGRGDDFEVANYGGWGTGIQDDITDAVKYVVAQGLADAGKMCIYGVSFGGYSAMMNPIRNPGMYKCAIAYAGVYDMDKHYEFRNGSKQGRSFFEMTMGDQAARRAQSPALQIEKLDAPLLLIHGKTDYIVPFDQFNIADSALKRAGKTYETLAKADEGHGFYKEANRAEAYARIRAFLLKYNPPN